MGHPILVGLHPNIFSDAIDFRTQLPIVKRLMLRKVIESFVSSISFERALQF